MLDRANGGTDVRDGDGIGRAAESRRDCCLVARAHGHQRSERARQPEDAVGCREQGRGAVLAPQPDLEGLRSGIQRGTLPLAILVRGLHLGQPVVQVAQQGDGSVVLGVQAPLARIEAGDARLE